VDPIDTEPAWAGLPLIPTWHAAQAMDELRLDLWDVLSILESGYDCEKGRRKAGIRERCCGWRGITLKVIVCKEASGWVEDRMAWIILNVLPC